MFAYPPGLTLHAPPFPTSRRFADYLRLGEQQKVVCAARLGIGATYVEAAEGLGAYRRTGALAVSATGSTA